MTEKKEQKNEVVENYFQTLNKIDCSDKVEKKNGLSYLSWAYAWAEVKKLYPDANYKIYERDDGCIYWTDGRTAWVKTGVTICGIEHIEYLPVMDFKNKSIALNAITSFDVNKTIQRSLTKAVARHGLGLYIYAGEDLPEDAAKEQAEKQTETQKETPKAEVKKEQAPVKQDAPKLTAEEIKQKEKEHNDLVFYARELYSTLKSKPNDSLDNSDVLYRQTSEILKKLDKEKDKIALDNLTKMFDAKKRKV